MAATIWKGVIEFGRVQVPVRFLSAVQDRGIHFNLLHEKDLVRVRQAMVNPATGEVVPNDQIQRGFQVDDNTYVTLDEEELEELVPKESRSIKIQCFVPNEQINHQWYERAYYLGPDGHAADYSALVKALEDSKLEGLAHWVMRKRAYVGSLQASQGCLVMMALRHADEVVPVSSLPQPQGREFGAKELQLAEELVATLHADFDIGRYRDEYRDRVMKFIGAKAKGRKPKLKLAKPPARKEPEDLTSVLSKSVQSLKKGRRIA